MTTYAAIPTLYQGISFRSRLEAKWACFFDLMKWRWSYESADLQGYIPDFILHLKEDVLVEVKPSFDAGEIRDHTAKIDASGWTGDALIVGATTEIRSRDIPGELVSGVVRRQYDDRYDGDGRYNWFELLLVRCPECKKKTPLGFSRGLTSGFRCLVCGLSESGTERFVAVTQTTLQANWAIACNKTKWLPRGDR